MNIAFRGLVLLILALAGQACYAQAKESGWYLGVGVGGSRTSYSNVDFTLTPPVAGTTESQNTNRTGAKFFAGYDFTKNWGIEGGFASLGTPEYKYGGTVNGQDRFKATSWNLAGKGTLPLGDKFNIFGKLGVSSNRASSSTATTGGLVQNVSATKTRTDTLAGVGGTYHINSNISVRLEYESYGKFGNAVNHVVATPGETGRATIGLWSVGMVYKF